MYLYFIILRSEPLYQLQHAKGNAREAVIANFEARITHVEDMVRDRFDHVSHSMHVLENHQVDLSKTLQAAQSTFGSSY
jgi:hypothetical protein